MGIEITGKTIILPFEEYEELTKAKEKAVELIDNHEKKMEEIISRLAKEGKLYIFIKNNYYGQNIYNISDNYCSEILNKDDALVKLAEDSYGVAEKFANIKNILKRIYKSNKWKFKKIEKIMNGES